MNRHSLHISKNHLPLFLLGVSAGLTVAVDPLATRILNLPIPYLFTAIVLVLFGLGSLLTLVQERVSSMRHQLALLALIIGLQTTSLQVGIDIGEVVIAILIPLILIEIFAASDRKFLITPLSFIVVLFFIVIVASLAKDFNPIAIRKEVKAIVIFFLTLNLLHWSKLNRSATHWFILVTTYSALFALVQEVFYVSTGEVLVGNIDQVSLKRMFEETAIGPIFRVPALTNGYREFALIVCLAISLLTANLFYLRKYRKTMWYLALCISLLALSFTFAKDILLGLSLGFSLILFLYRPKLLLPASLCAGFACFGAIMVLSTTPGGWDTASDMFKSLPTAERERMQLDREGIEGLIASKEFLLGAGVNAKGRFTDHHQGWKAHNAFILAADAGGLLALLSYGAVYMWLFWRLLHINFMARSQEELALARGLLMFFATAIIALQFTSEYMEMIFWFYAAITETLAIQIAQGNQQQFATN